MEQRTSHEQRYPPELRERAMRLVRETMRAPRAAQSAS